MCKNKGNICNIGKILQIFPMLQIFITYFYTTVKCLVFSHFLSLFFCFRQKNMSKYRKSLFQPANGPKSICLLVEIHNSNRISIIWFRSQQQLHNANYILSVCTITIPKWETTQFLQNSNCTKQQKNPLSQ